MNIFKKISKKAAIGIAGVASGIFYLATNDAVLALLPAPYALVIKTFVTGAASGGVYYSMKPKENTLEE